MTTTSDEGPRPNAAPAAAGEARAALVRWEDFGGTSRLMHVRGCTATVSLCRCDGGEVVDVVESDDPAFVSWVRGHHDDHHDHQS